MADETNTLWGPVENFRDLLAASALYQVLLGVNGEAVPATAAHAKIYTPCVPTTLDPKAARPYGVVGAIAPASWTLTSSDSYKAKGTLVWSTEITVPNAHKAAGSEEAADHWFITSLSNVVDQILAAAITGGLFIQSMEIEDGPSRTDPRHVADQGDYYSVTFKIQYGAD